MGIAKQLTYTWTPGGRLAMVEDSDGHMASMSYDPTGRLASVAAPNGETISATDTSRPVTCFVYTVLGDTKEIWAGSTTDTTSKTCVLDGVSVKKQLSRTFDDWGRKLTETDALGNIWKWTWNVHNQLVASQTPTQIAAGQSTVYAYGSKGAAGETQGQLKSRSVPGTNGQTVAYTRNALGLVTHAETKNGSNQLVVAYDYDYDAAKRLRSVTDSRPGMGIGKQLAYTWTPGGRLALVEDSDGHMASMSYDPTGRLASVIAPNGETIGFTYDAGGRLIETRLNSGQRTTQSWFEDGNLKQRQNLYNSTVLTSHLYTLDNQGRRATQSENIGGTTKTWAYLYDNLDRLTSASDGTAETYSYDIWGNRRSKTKSGITTAYLYDAAQQLSEIHSGSDTGPLIGAAVHDADGRMMKLCEVSTGGTVTNPAGDCTASGTGSTTLALVWNALDQLNTATRTGANAIAESYVYDDSGRRISKTSGATTTSYLYDGDDIHAEWNGSISGMPAAAYVQGPGIDNPLLRLTGTTNSPAATEAAYLQDGIGSVVGLANTTGTLTANQRFDAWGNTTASSGTTPTYGYTGREPDATGLVFYRARYYHPGLGRFASRDPMGMADSVSPYAYVANNPVNLIDPDGLLAQLAGTTPRPAYWGMLADNSSLSSALTDTGLGVWNGVLGAVEGAANLVGGGAIPGAIDYVPFLDPLRAKYDTPAFGTTIEVLTGVGAFKVLGEIGAASRAGQLGAPTVATEVSVSRSRFPESAQHIEDAITAGKPNTLTIDRANAASRRQDALRGIPTRSGLDRDEFPPAMFQEGGQGSSVRYINPSDNRGAGACIGAQCRGLPDGTKVQINVVN